MTPGASNGGPIRVALPHSLGKEGARARLEANAGRLASHIPGGAADVKTSWSGDRMTIVVAAMGQTVTAHADVEEKRVRVEIELPFLLGLFRDQVERVVEKEAPKLLS